jgi:arylsulfatase A
MRQSLLFLLLLIALPLSAANERPPNLLLIYLDNLGYGDLGCYGNREIQTPRMDQLAAEGVRCTDFYVVSPGCTPSRGALLTGRYPPRNGLVHQLVTTENWTGIGLPQRERLLPQWLKPAGYATACYGKWNIGFAPGSRPTERGFDDFFGCRSGNIHYFAHTYHGEYDLFKGTDLHRVEGYSTDLFADAAADFIARQGNHPWLVYLPFNAPHYVSEVNTAPGETPEWHVPDRHLARYGWPANDRTEKHRYLALVSALDEAVGRVLDSVDAAGQREQTLVMLLSDMGAILRPTHGLGVASNAPFRDGAPSVYEGGVRVPAIFRWPGRLPAGRVCEALLSHLDLLPLCLEAAGLKGPQERVIDGRNPLPALRGEAGTPHERLFFSYASSLAVREGSHKLVRPKGGAPWELYDLAQDPGESTDLAAAQPERVARLVQQVEAWQLETRRDASPPERAVIPRRKK